jgi:hypothetical protein
MVSKISTATQSNGLARMDDKDHSKLNGLNQVNYKLYIEADRWHLFCALINLGLNAHEAGA